MLHNNAPVARSVSGKDLTVLAKLLFGDKHKEHPPHLLRILWAIEGGVITSFARLVKFISPDRASSIGRWLMRMLGPRMDKTRLMRRNLRLAFPEKQAEEIDDLIRDIWGNLGSVMAEYPHLGTICDREADQRLDYEIKGDPQVFRDHSKPAVFVSAHLANWELAAGAIVHQGIPFSAVYTTLQNPSLDHMLFKARQSLGYELVEREGAARQLVRCLKQGNSVGLIVDQRVDSGEPVKFFHHDMLTSITPAQLALKFGCELIPVQIQRRQGANFRVIFHEPVTVDDGNLDEHEKILQMTRKINAAFESWIRERPHEWLCSKRRWAKAIDKSGD